MVQEPCERRVVFYSKVGLLRKQNTHMGNLCEVVERALQRQPENSSVSHTRLLTRCVAPVDEKFRLSNSGPGGPGRPDT